LLQLFRHIKADEIGDARIPELPHHALLDARLLAGFYRELNQTQSNKERGSGH
jgi:hypothetical protein